VPVLLAVATKVSKAMQTKDAHPSTYALKLNVRIMQAATRAYAHAMRDSKAMLSSNAMLKTLVLE